MLLCTQPPAPVSNGCSNAHMEDNLRTVLPGVMPWKSAARWLSSPLPATHTAPSSRVCFKTCRKRPKASPGVQLKQRWDPCVSQHPRTAGSCGWHLERWAEKLPLSRQAEAGRQTSTGANPAGSALLQLPERFLLTQLLKPALRTPRPSVKEQPSPPFLLPFCISRLPEQVTEWRQGRVTALCSQLAWQLQSCCKPRW